MTESYLSLYPLMTHFPILVNSDTYKETSFKTIISGVGLDIIQLKITKPEDSKSRRQQEDRMG